MQGSECPKRSKSPECMERSKSPECMERSKSPECLERSKSPECMVDFENVPIKNEDPRGIYNDWKRIGKGGTGEVFSCFDLRSHKRVAIKKTLDSDNVYNEKSELEQYSRFSSHCQAFRSLYLEKLCVCCDGADAIKFDCYYPNATTTYAISSCYYAFTDYPHAHLSSQAFARHLDCTW